MMNLDGLKTEMESLDATIKALSISRQRTETQLAASQAELDTITKLQSFAGAYREHIADLIRRERNAN